MKKFFTSKNFFFSFLLLFAFITTIGVNTVSASTITQITDNTLQDTQPNIHGNSIVWQSSGSGYWSVFLYDILTGETKLIDSKTYGGADIYGQKIVWVAPGTGTLGYSQVFLHDITTNETIQISNSIFAWGPRIDGNYIVWRSDDGADTEIMMYDIVSGETTQLTNNDYSEDAPRVSGDKVVWHNSDSFGGEIFLYDINTQVTTQITDNSLADNWAEISGNRIVWQRYGITGKWAVMLHDINSGETKQISSSSIYSDEPDIDGNKVVWRSLASNRDLYLYDIATGETRQITNEILQERSPKISGDNIVWRSYDGTDDEIYLLREAVAPDILPLQSVTLNEGDTLNEIGYFTDPDSTSWTGLVDYGEGLTAALSINATDKTFNLSHLYMNNKVGDEPYVVSLEITDNQRLTDVDSVEITVKNVAPIIQSITTSSDPVQSGTPTTVHASFTDQGREDTHSAVWDWGDGSSSNGAVSEADGYGTVIESHIYATPGVYTVTLTITDSDNASVSREGNQYVVVYDPAAGFVTGGGTISSPVGAFTTDASLSGVANFGFVSRYQKGATTPTGQTQFRFSVADFTFHSTTYDWLVIAGAKAQYKGTGSVNGEDVYGFILTAVDGDLIGGNGSDKFRIKIWDKLSGVIVYDNQLGVLDTEEPATVITSGSIKIHK